MQQCKVNEKKAGMKMGFSGIFQGWHICSFLLLRSSATFYLLSYRYEHKKGGEKGWLLLLSPKKCSERSLCEAGLLWVSVQLICRSMEARLRQQEF